jgi:fibronectin-binding autotransporter adhesin
VSVIRGALLHHRIRHAITATVVLLTLALALWNPSPARSQTWVGPGTDYNTASNWSTNAVPNGSGVTATFAGTTAPSTVNLSNAVILIRGFTYDAGAQTYTVTVSNGSLLQFNGAVINSSSNVQNLVATGAGSQLNFNASPGPPGNVTLTANSGSIISFSQSGSAGASQLIANGGTIEFLNASSGGTSQVTLNGGGSLSLQQALQGGVTIGSLAGSGTVLGSSRLETLGVGSNNLSTTFSGRIIDNGASVSLAKVGTGTLTLAGANTYSGATTISGGTLALSGNGTIASSSQVNLSNSGTTFDISGTTAGASITTLNGVSGSMVALGAQTLTITDGSTTYAGEIQGSGGLTLAGGTQTLAGANSYTGATVVNAGALQAGAANTFAPLSAFTIGSGATLGLNGFDQTIGSLSGAGGVTLGSATLTTGNDNTNTTFSGLISGSGGLAKVGSGTFALTGANSYAGGTIVSAGTLVVDGSIANSMASVLSGATLGGKGMIGGLVANSGSTIAPGLATPFSTLSVAGNASFAAGSTYLVNVSANGQNDKLAVGGAATLSGGTVDVLAGSGSFTPATRFTLLSASGGVSGMFAQLVTSSNLSQAYAFLTPSLLYDANDVFLGFKQTTNFTSVAVTPNQAATAAAVQALGLGNPIFNAVVGQSFTGARQAFDALSGEVHASAVTAAFEDSRLPRETILDRLSQPFTGPTLGSTMAAYAANLPTKARPMAPPPDPQTLSFWGQAFGDFGHSGTDGNAASLSRSTDGFVIGGDASVIGAAGGDWRFGAAGGYTSDNISVADRSSSGTFQSAFAAVYGGASFGVLQLRSGAIYGVNTTATSRQIIFPGFGENATSSYGGSTTQVFGEAGYRIGLMNFNWAGLSFNRAMLEPFLGAAGIHLHQDGFTEAGGIAALNGFEQGYDLATTTLGLRGETTLGGPMPLTARALLGWRRAYGDVLPTALMAFQGGTQPFTIAGVPIDRDAFVTEVGFDYAANSALTLGVAYSGQYGEHASDSAVKGRIDLRF